MPEMTTPRSNHSIEIMDRHIYAIGGFDGDGTTAAVEAFDLETRKWTQMSKLQIKISALCCVTVPARDLSKDLVRELERKELFLERKRISLLKDGDSKVRLELLNSFENLMNEDDEDVLIVHPILEYENPHVIEANNIENEDDIDLGDMIAIENMAGQLDNAVGDQLHQIEEEYDSSSEDSLSTNSSSEDEAEGHDDVDSLVLPLLFQVKILEDMGFFDSESEED